MFGFITLNKNAGITSRRAIDTVKQIVHPAKVGHSGTLDPLASGVLVVGIGPATRLTRFVQEMPKTYVASFRFGVRSRSDDIESELIHIDNAKPFEQETLEAKLPIFIGDISQVPPEFSAVKVDGKRAYKRARAGESFEIKPKQVTVYSIEILGFDYPNCQLKISCGSGTYIRSIGRDLGISLESGAVMTDLVRDSVGCFQIEEAISNELLNLDSIQQNFVSPTKIFEEHHQITFSNKQIEDLAQGALFSTAELKHSTPAQHLAAVDSNRNLLAILSPHKSGAYKPEINFVHYYLSK